MMGLQKRVILENGRISIRHDGVTSFPATVKASKEIPQIIQVGSTKETDIPCHVLVIRRDSSQNIFVYDRKGEVVATLPGGTRDNVGSLLIERLGPQMKLNQLLPQRLHCTIRSYFFRPRRGLCRYTSAESF